MTEDTADRQGVLSSNTELGLWTPQRISRFWDLVSEEARFEALYFGRQAAPQLIRFATLVGLTHSDDVLDYGCGPGHLTHALVEAGYETTGLEFSPKSASALNRRLQAWENNNWHSCQVSESIPTPLDSDAYSFVFSTEAYEHLRDEWIEPFFAELYRIIRPGGCLMMTTPAEEDLDQSLIICPVCESKFHRWGHLRSCRREDLISGLEGAGFHVRYASAINIKKVDKPPVKLLDVSLRQLKGWMAERYYRFKEAILPSSFPDQWDVRRIPSGPNLVVVAKK